jgi:preprotein translocase, secE subunit
LGETIVAASTKSTKGKKKQPTVTRIKASDNSAPKRAAAVKAKQNAAASAATKSTPSAKEKSASKAKRLLGGTRKSKDVASSKKSTSSRRNPLRAVRGYFVGAWQELKQVRWPDRRSTWAMTGALIAFTVVFVVVILLIDYGFSWLFKLIIGTK